MDKRGRLQAAGWSFLGLIFLFLPLAPTQAAGFALTSAQGAKAAGMAGAFAAQADDASAIFYNPGAVAFLKKKVAAGFGASAFSDGHYQGQAPGIGAGTTGNQNQLFTLPVQAFAVKPLGPTLKLGVGAYSPFGFRTGWQNPETFPGRTVSTAVELKTYDVNATLAWQATPGFGLGAGLVYRNALLQHRRRLQSRDPLSGNLVDVASLSAKTDYDRASGWTAGLLDKGGPLSIGLSYRSPLTIRFGGAGRLSQVLTGNAQIDALTRASLPLDQDLAVSSEIVFPGEATLAIAIAPSETVVIEADVNRTGWKKFTGLTLAFPNNPTLSAALQGAYKDVNSYRLGLRLGPPRGPQWRLGYALEESPQPDESVGPFFADGRRSVIGVGFGLDWLDIAFQWEKPADRTVFASQSGLNGTYRASIYRLAISISPM
jgi:long-chain fatty acid transport protein